MIGLVAEILIDLKVPERFARAAAWVLLVVLAVGIIVGAKAIYDASVIDRHETELTARDAKARDDAAEERAADAMTNMVSKAQRETAIAKAEASETAKPPEARATGLPATTRARRCVQFEQSYTTEELTKIPAYQENCK